MSAYDFDTLVDRSGTSSAKWTYYGPDVLPFWVADMDFRAPPGLLAAVAERLDHGVLGYTMTPPELEAAFIDWLERRFGWKVVEDWLVWLPGVVPGLNLAGRAVSGGSLLIPAPVYFPFLAVPGHADKAGIVVDLVRAGGPGGERWVMDMDRFEAAVRPDTGGFLLCNPQNPTGRVYGRAELETLVEFCLRHGLTLVSDEIHCDLLLDPDVSHTCVASLAPELKTITLFGPNKSYNIPGLGVGVAVIPDAELRRAFLRARAGLIGPLSPLAYVSAQWAYSERTDWLPRLNGYLRANRDRLQETVAGLSGVEMTHVEGTYLGWLDVRELDLEDPAGHFERHGLGFSDGARFGGPGFQRFNFGCPRTMLEEGLARFVASVENA
ncbi:MAG: PatB family C-S lyase [Gammaproteobacteria bacterium]|nr:PatB family C-S lyase [Gammaproteobacteria bacterium]